MAKIKNNTKMITSLKIFGVLQSDQDLLGNHVAEYLKSLFSKSNVVGLDPDLIENNIPHLLVNDINSMIHSVPNALEIQEVVFCLNIKWGHGPDGLGAFLKH